ncbi:MAG: MarR family transcriptional regulator [Sphingomonas fennica]
MGDGVGEAVMAGGAAAADAPDMLPGWTVADLDYPTFRITLLAKIMARLTTRRLADRGDLTYAEWRLLSRLAAFGPGGGTVGQVADLAWVDRAEVSRAAVALEARGLTGRRVNPSDRRTPILHLTDEGRDHYEEALRERADFHHFLLADLNDADRAVLDEMLGRIAGRMQTLLADQGEGA